MGNKVSKKICAIICELNPPHNGHQYLINKARELSGCDYVLLIMSPNYVQRGEPAIFDCSTRAQMALTMGADAVVFMPTEYSTASAEIFCKAGVKIASSFKNVTHLAFGIDGDIDKILRLATLIKNNKSEIDALIVDKLKLGQPYSKAKNDAIISVGKLMGINAQSLLTPNNIVAFEYLINIPQSITPLLVQRAIGDDIISASQLRELLIEASKGDDISQTLKYAPKSIHNQYKNAEIVDYSKFQEFIIDVISITPKHELSKFRDVGEGMENLFISKMDKAQNYDDFMKAIKSKRYSVKRLNRACLAIALKIYPTHNIEIDKLKLAGASDDAIKYLDCSIPLITRASSLENIADNLDERSSRLYYNFFKNNKKSSFWLKKLIKSDIFIKFFIKN